MRWQTPEHEVCALRAQLSETRFRITLSTEGGTRIWEHIRKQANSSI